MEQKNNILLNLAIHRYDEINERNNSVDNKNKSMIAFIGVMLTIEVTALPLAFNLLAKSTVIYGVRMLMFLAIISISNYLVSILSFISAITFVKTFQEAPVANELILSLYNDDMVDLIIKKNLISISKCIMDNHEIIEEKTEKAKLGFEFFKHGLITMVSFLILFILILWR